MNTIGDLLARDLRKKIVEIIQVDDTDEQAVYDELTEYVPTNRIKEQYRTLLRAMADMPQQPHDGVGVWLSGFFGSGKSSFAKNLGYALANPTVCGRPAADLFKEQLKDSGLAELIDFLNRRVPCEVIMFDVSKASEVRRGDEKIAEVVYRSLLRKFDYALDFDVAELEIWLEEQGKLEEFIALCPQVNEGLDWRRARKGALKINYASAILNAMDPRRFPEADSWAKSLPSRHVTITVQTVVERAFQFAARRGGGKALVFIIDEVGQYVARSAAKIEDLRALVEEFGQVGKNLVKQKKAIAPAWFLVTAQEKLEEVVDALESKRVDRAKMQDRFKYRIDLAPADIREVATKRVLAKKPEPDSQAIPLLRKLYQGFQGVLHAATRLERSAVKSDVGEQDFIDLYPYLPQYIDLSISIMSGIRLQPGAPRQLGGSCRTIIKQAYEMLVSPRTALAEKPIGTLVTLDRVFELVEGNLPTEKQKDVSDVAARFRDDPEDQGMAARVARAVCLLEYVRGLARTNTNIAACLVDAVGQQAPVQLVDRALYYLQELQFVRSTEEGWKLQTTQEKSWDTERRTHLDPRPRDRQEIIRAALSELFGEPRLKTFRYRDRKTFRVGLRLDGQPVEDGQFVLSLCLADDEAAYPAKVDEVRSESRHQSHKNDVYWVAALNAEADRLVANLYASQQMIAKYRQLRAQQKISHDEGSCLDAEDLQAQRLQGLLRSRLAEALETGKGLFRGVEADGADLGKSLPEVLRKFFDRCVPELYPKLEMAPPALEGTEAEDFLKAARLDALPEVFHTGEGGLNLVVQEGNKYVANKEAEIAREVYGFLAGQHQYGNKVTGKVLEEHFGGVGYGWDRDVLRLVLAVLLRAGAIEVTHHGRRFHSHTDPQSRAPFASHTAFRAASFAPWKSIDLKTLTLAAQQLEDLTGDEADVEESALAAGFKKLADEELRQLLPLLAAAQAHRLPVLGDLQEYRQTLDTVLAAPSDDCVRILAGEGVTFSTTRKRVRQMRNLLTDAALATVGRARTAVEVLVPALLRQGANGTLADTAKKTQRLLDRPDFFEEIIGLDALTDELAGRYASEYAARHEPRTAEYAAALDEIRGRPEWELVPEGSRDAVLAPLTSRSCGPLDLPAGASACGRCGAALGQLESDLAALPGLRSQVLTRVEELTAAPEEQGRFERVRLAGLVAARLDSKEAVDEAVKRLHEHLLKLVSQGVTIIPE
jgi:hypothetical protein